MACEVQAFGAAGYLSAGCSLNCCEPPSSARGALGAAGGGPVSCALGAVGTVFEAGGAACDGTVAFAGMVGGRISDGAFHTLDVGPL